MRLSCGDDMAIYDYDLPFRNQIGPAPMPALQIRALISLCLLVGMSISYRCAAVEWGGDVPDTRSRIENAAPANSTNGWNGTAGAGFIGFPQYTGGKKLQTWLIPLLSINYNETFYVEIERVGVYVLASDDKKIGLGLAVEPRFGFNASANSRLAGMATRRNSVEGGLTFDWDFDFVAFSVAHFTDFSHTSRGSSQRLTVYAPFVKNNRWEVGGVLMADRMSARVTNYFFGIRPNEATLTRPAAPLRASTGAGIGLSGTYKIDKKQAVLFGGNVMAIGREAAKSAIVQTRSAPQLYLAYGWQL